MSRGGKRGSTIGIVLMTSVLISIGAYAVLYLATSQSKLSAVYNKRIRARYAAEAGLVWAFDQLWANPLEDFSANSPDLVVNGQNVEITVNPACAAAPCPPQTLRAMVSNY